MELKEHENKIINGLKAGEKVPIHNCLNVGFPEVGLIKIRV